MIDSDFSGALLELDYRAIVAFNCRLAECRRRCDFNGLLKEQLLPLLQSFSGYYFFSDADSNPVQICDSVNIPEQTLSVLLLMFSCDPIRHHMLSRRRLVMAYDVDLNRKELAAAKNSFFLPTPAHESLCHSIYRFHEHGPSFLEHTRR